MKRAPIVLAGTVAGLAGVLAYNTSSAPSTVVASSSAATAAQTATTVSTPTSSTASATASHTSSATTGAAPAGTTAKTRSATGEDVSFQYGDLQVKVTKSGSRITDVSVVTLNVNDPHSQSIDQVAIPELRQEAVAAKSANIDGVSGASYTSAAYEQSLQSALDKLA